jgi:hypothetical protein
MNLLDRLKAELNKISHNEVAVNMGYKAVKKGEKTIYTFLQSKSISYWLSSGHFDLKYTAEQFFVKLCALLNIEPNIVKYEIEFYEKTVMEYQKLETVYIFVNTNFKRESQPIFALAMMEFLRLILPEKESLIFKSDQDVMGVISDFVKSHFIENKGELKMWGEIDNYIYHHSDGKAYTFDKYGNLVKDAPEVFEDYATICL